MRTQNAVESFSKNGLTNKTRIVEKLGWAVGTYGFSHYRGPLKGACYNVIKKPGSQNKLEIHICCSLKRAPAAQKKKKEKEKEKARERENARGPKLNTPA